LCLIVVFLRQQMREAADRRKDLEREHADALAQLRDKQAEVCFFSRALRHFNSHNILKRVYV
jgi:hypothetical protein